MISLIQGLRVLLLSLKTSELMRSYVEKRFQKHKNGNVVYCCIHSILGCCECWMKYLSKNAYILVINRGYNLLQASVESFRLLAENLTVVSSLQTVYLLYLWLGKLSVCSL